MGFIRHDAIAVTAWDRRRANKAKRKAASLGLPVTTVSASVINGYCSFLICPDGSKEGWPDSDEGDRKREEWIKWVRDPKQKELYLDWSHVSYGGDDPDKAKLIDFNRYERDEE